MPSQKAHFLEMEQRWLLAAGSVAPKSERQTKARMTRPKVAKVAKARPIQFTPDKIEQIRSLVESGKSRDEIAEFIGVTVGSLQVTCSKLGISLRPPRPSPQINVPRREVPYTATMLSTSRKAGPVRFAFEQVDQFLQGPQEEKDVATPAPDEIGDQPGDRARVALAVHYKGVERVIPLCLSDEAVGRLVMEAQLRGVSVGQFVSALIRDTLEKGLSHVLGGESPDVASPDAGLASKI
jgi:hypothetical protein